MASERDSWGEFLATPPNMVGTPPSMVPGGLLSNLQPPSSTPFGEIEINEIFQQNPVSIPPISSQMQSYSQYNQNGDFGELENRTLLITNANPETTENDIRFLFNQNHGISKIDLSQIDKGTFTVEYYDLRQANTSKLLHNGAKLCGNIINIAFAPLQIIPDPKRPPNNGTIVIFHLPTSIKNDQILTIFGQFGEIRQIRGTPSKTTQKFVEYWDTRGAEAALVAMNGKLVMGARVSIEFSLPGGFRRGIQKVDSSQSQVYNQRSSFY